HCGHWLAGYTAKCRDNRQSRDNRGNQMRVPIMAFVALMLLPTAQANAAPKAFRDCRDCPEMVIIPGGSFEMGSPDSEPDRDRLEGPLHRVEVPSFAAGKYDVTRGEFGAFVRAKIGRAHV